MGIVFCKNSFSGELFWHFRIYGYDFRKIFQIYEYTVEKSLQVYGWYFYDWNGTTPYLGKSSYRPSPPGGKTFRIIVIPKLFEERGNMSSKI